MKRVREKVRRLTGRNRCGTDVRKVISESNPILRGWGNYYRTGSAANKFVQLDLYVVRRLKGLMRKRHEKHLRVGMFETRTRDWFEAHGLYRLRGTIRYPEAA
jgi:RNA-directed DNA polymerase